MVQVAGETDPDFIKAQHGRGGKPLGERPRMFAVVNISEIDSVKEGSVGCSVATFGTKQ
ncbi:hypothetical protein GGH94_000602 [Coemansia aciculifera]|uniref:Uncharacterized protein n=1 Tax=Coemansia aciculifera TaxID=417176 RepID=A0A9W8INC1_9FUNG|nr:hypothetical protein GGH94_000602 [Coemansia aciculifera]